MYNSTASFYLASTCNAISQYNYFRGSSMKKIHEKLSLVLLMLLSLTIIFAVASALVFGSSAYIEPSTANVARHEALTANAEGSAVKFYMFDLADAEPDASPDATESEDIDTDAETTAPDEGRQVGWIIWFLIATIIILLLVVETLFLVQYLRKPKNAIAGGGAKRASPEVVVIIKTENSAPKAATEVKEEAVEDETAVAVAEPIEESETEESEPEIAVAPEPESEQTAPVAEIDSEAEDDDAAEEDDSEDTLPLFAEDGTRLFYDKSFSARLSLATNQIKEYYSELKNYILSYNGVRSRVSWHFDSFNKGRTKCAKLQLRGKSIYMYIALSISEIPEKYNVQDMSNTSRYADVPTVLKVRKPRSIKHAKELVSMLMEKLGLQQGEIPNENYIVDNESDEALIEKGLIKVKTTNSDFAAFVNVSDTTEE